jgi:hypothetical protein
LPPLSIHRRRNIRIARNEQTLETLNAERERGNFFGAAGGRGHWSRILHICFDLLANRFQFAGREADRVKQNGSVASERPRPPLVASDHACPRVAV